MTNEEAITIIRNEYKCVDQDCDIERSCGKCNLMIPSKEPILEAYKLAIKALEQQPCDAISREAAINIASLHCLTIDETVKALEQLPSVTQKYGKWIDREIYDADRWKCSECGRTEQYRENYCPNCGCRMVEPQESEK